MNITDGIIDKILYKKLKASPPGAPFEIRTDYIQVDQTSGEVTAFNYLFKIGGSIRLHIDSGDIGVKPATPLTRVYVNGEVVHTYTNFGNMVDLEIPAFAKVKVTFSTTSGKLRCNVNCYAEIVDNYEMYATEVSE